MISTDDEKFRQMLEALRPALDDVVIIGGWAHALFRKHRLARRLGYTPLRTVDVDVALASRMPPAVADLRGRLIEYGFTEEFLGDDQPPVTHYRLSEDSEFYVEFLTPMLGSETKRGRADATEMVAGVPTQRLRHLDVLLIDPWTVPYELTTGTELVRMANPVSFILQKLLISGRRPPPKRAKDVLYIHDTLEVFGASLSDLGRFWREQLAGRLPSRLTAKAATARRRLFAEPNDVIREAAIIATARALSPTRLLEACQLGLGLIFD
jgi:hypothetical protein